MNVAPLAATPAAERVASLDAVRGFALLGILCVNLPYMTHPLAIAVRPPPSGADTGEHVAWALVRALCETKFIALFAMLFGAGLALASERARARDRSFQKVGLRRLAALLVFGLGHGFLVWYGDVLTLYAVGGLVLLALHKGSSRSLARLAAALLALSCATGIGIALVFPLTPLPAATPVPASAPSGWSAIVASQDHDAPAWIAAETRALRDGPWIDAFAFRATYYVMFLAFEGSIALVRVLGLFLVGVLLVRTGFFTDRVSPWPARAFRVGLPVGLAAAGVELALRVGPAGPTWLAACAFAYELAGLALPLGMLGAIQLAVNGGHFARGLAWLGALGRVAFSAYLAQSVIGTGLAGPAGCGWFGRLSRVEMLALAVGIWLAQLALARAWLVRFDIGPAEWLWRWATYGVRPRWRRG